MTMPLPDHTIVDSWSKRADSCAALDPEEAVKCLVEAESYISDVSETLTVARAWAAVAQKAPPNWTPPPSSAGMLGSAFGWGAGGRSKCFAELGRERSVSLLRKAEQMAVHYYEHLFVSKAWWDTFDQPFTQNAQRCVKVACTLARTTLDWMYCVDVWVHVHENKDLGPAFEMIKRMEALSERSFDWMVCSRAWAYVRGGEERDAQVRRCLMRAEAIAKWCCDWTDAAEGYAVTESDEERNTRRGLLRAEEFAETRSQWESCAYAWREWAEYEEGYRRCMMKAKQAKEE